MISSRTHILLPALSALLAFSSCMKKELPVAAHETGNITTATVDMDATYRYQVYYKLSTNTIAGKHLKTTWDLGFEAGEEGYHVVLNGAKSMFAMYSGKTDFANVATSDTAGFSHYKEWDSPNGNMDSTAIGDWRNTNKVFIVDRGYDEMGQALGMAKVQFLSVTSSDYQVRIASLDGSNEATVTLQKDSAYNLVFLSIADKVQVQAEPPKATWDLAFTQYTYIFTDLDPPVPYLVTGCLLNRYSTLAYRDTVTPFANISYSTISKEQLSNDISSIGYDWKIFNGTGYTIVPNRNYIISDAEGIMYKLHFTSFYNATGIKGNPQWECQRL